MTQDLLFAVTLSTNSQMGSIINEMLPSIDLYPTSYFDRKDSTACLSLYFDDKVSADDVRSKIMTSLNEWSSYCDIRIDEVEVISHEIKREDWSETWKVFFNIDKVSERLVIKPSWKEYIPSEGEVVLEIDPGMSFGTGSHGTTKACLQFLDEIAQPGMSLIDMGCGSGILSLAAAKLGLAPIVAFDYDHDAVRICGENLQNAGVIIDKVYQQDLTEFIEGQKFDIVIANILAPVLMMNADRIVSALKPASKLLLSGILHTQFDEIVDSFELAGVSLIARKQVDEWSTGLFSPSC
jgi:ribosomal protein L11 methyltransferase